MTKKIFTFPLDGKKFNNKADLYTHIESQYGNMLSDNMSAKRLYFNLKYNKTDGKCVMSGKPTQFNEATEKYERFHSEIERGLYREQFKQRMLNKYNKVHILDEPAQQKMMLGNRKISKDYIWADKSRTIVTGDYEYHFLEFLEHTYNFKSSYLMEPPTFYYEDEGQVRFYLPDFYIPSLNLIIEIKGSNDHYQKRDSYKEELKRKAVLKEKINFLQVNDKKYTTFNIFFKENVFDK